MKRKTVKYCYNERNKECKQTKNRKKEEILNLVKMNKDRKEIRNVRTFCFKKEINFIFN